MTSRISEQNENGSCRRISRYRPSIRLSTALISIQRSRSACHRDAKPRGSARGRVRRPARHGGRAIPRLLPQSRAGDPACGSTRTTGLPIETSPLPWDRDRDGRQVARCFLGNSDLNGWMVSEGLAVTYTGYSVRYLPAETTACLNGPESGRASSNYLGTGGAEGARSEKVVGREGAPGLRGRGTGRAGSAYLERTGRTSPR